MTGCVYRAPSSPDVALELIAPAKLNLTLEVLGGRPDGYHEIASVMQTIDLADHLRLEPADGIVLVATGDEAGALPEDAESNLAYRAAVALRYAAGRPDLGARISLDKRIPAGAGLGGGSSDAAAVLRGLNRVWRLDLDVPMLTRIAERLGSDVPFFLHGGSARVGGRGEAVDPLPDVEAFEAVLLLPRLEPDDKTARMYAALDDAGSGSGMPPGSAGGRSLTPAASRMTTPGSDAGERTRHLSSRIIRGSPVRAEDLYNAFDQVVAVSSADAGRVLQLLRDAAIPAIVCGSGAALLAVAPLSDIERALPADADLRLITCRSLSREEALAMQEA
jgi:4-diphosphocytidyl-2-C-methyl-D-erythritol kinase